MDAKIKFNRERFICKYREIINHINPDTVIEKTVNQIIHTYEMIDRNFILTDAMYENLCAFGEAVMNDGILKPLDPAVTRSVQ